MRTKVHSWMIKATTKSFSALCLNKGAVLDHVMIQISSLSVMKTSIRFPEQKSKLFKGSSSAGS